MLKVEALQREEQRRQKELKEDLASSPTGHARAGRKRHHTERVTTEFFVEKNDMRFTGEGENAPFGESPAYTIEQTYANYRCFRVRTRDEIRTIVSGPSRPAPPSGRERP